MTKPPKPPAGTGINLDGNGVLWTTTSSGVWRDYARSVTVFTLDNTGKRTTVTRVALIGPLAFLAKKKTGDVTVILAASSGATATVKVKPKQGPEVMAWAVAHNAWAAAQN